MKEVNKMGEIPLNSQQIRELGDIGKIEEALKERGYRHLFELELDELASGGVIPHKSTEELLIDAKIGLAIDLELARKRVKHDGRPISITV